jgi:hypothetical protein
MLEQVACSTAAEQRFMRGTEFAVTRDCIEPVAFMKTDPQARFVGEVAAQARRSI